MKKNVFYLGLLVLVTLFSCGIRQKSNTVITIKNSLDMPREFETVEIFKKDLNLKPEQDFEVMGVMDLVNQTMVVSQLIDLDGDGASDVLLFQPKLEANAQKQFELVVIDSDSKNNLPVNCYSRFVPERTDDYTWENDKVAFRTYGSTAQKMIEDGVKGGTLSSGIDAWCKKVEYPIINKWYAANDKKQGAYHIDSGEGLDNFHVGPSRGVGGSAVKIDSVYYISKNFTTWKTVSVGPIRTSFVLDYEAWDANGTIITEKKFISLDYGSNLSRFEIHTTGTDILSVGLTLHDNKGETTENVNGGWISYWEPLDDSEIGTAIVTKQGTMLSSEKYVTTQKDRSNLYAQLQVDNSKVVYYAGFAWKESKQYPTKKDWELYINNFSRKLNNPLKVILKK